MATLEKKLEVRWTSEEIQAFRKTFETFYETADRVSRETGTSWSMKNVANLFTSEVGLDRNDDVKVPYTLTFPVKKIED